MSLRETGEKGVTHYTHVQPSVRQKVEAGLWPPETKPWRADTRYCVRAPTLRISPHGSVNILAKQRLLPMLSFTHGDCSNRVSRNRKINSPWLSESLDTSRLRSELSCRYSTIRKPACAQVEPRMAAKRPDNVLFTQKMQLLHNTERTKLKARESCSAIVEDVQP